MADPLVADAGTTVRHAIALADRLGMADAFRSSRKFLERERELQRVVREEQQKARTRRGQELQRLVTGTTPVAVMVVQATVAETDPWLDQQVAADASSAFPASAVALLREAARVCRGHAAAAAAAASTGLYRDAQHQAQACVQQVKGVKLPGKVWSVPDPGHWMLTEGRERDWATLTKMQDRFALIHQLGAVLRGFGGLGAEELLPDGAPTWGFAYANWRVVDEQQLRPLAPQLRLPHAIRSGWAPGLWSRSDLEMPEPGQASRGLMGWLVPSPLRAPAG